MAQPELKLTIGMAHFADAYRLRDTIQQLRLYHSEAIKHCELVVVDNSAGIQQFSNQTKYVQHTLGKVAKSRNPIFQGVSYRPLTDKLGTTPSRDLIFEIAKAPHVLVIDCHVAFPPGALAKLIEWLSRDENHKSEDLFHGPLLLDDLYSSETHFADEWGAGMWGKWQRAWQCGCGPEGVYFGAKSLEGKLSCESLSKGPVTLSSCGACGRSLPQSIPWAGYEDKLRELGFREPTKYYNEETDTLELPPNSGPFEKFEIPAQGLGIFLSRKDSWLGFNKDARYFGGEEWMIHEKYRQEGRKVWSLPFLPFVHSFAMEGAVPYPAPNLARLANYVHWARELNLDLEPTRAHFVDELKSLPQSEWDRFLENPSGYRAPELRKAPNGQPELQGSTVEELFNSAKGIKRDLDEHLDTIADLARSCNHVTEISKRRESAIGLAMGKPSTLISYLAEDTGDPSRDTLAGVAEMDFRALSIGDLGAEPIEETDLLLIDWKHNAKDFLEMMENHSSQVDRFIILHDTEYHGRQGDNGGAGLVLGMKEFVKAHPEWFVVEHHSHQYGLTVLGKLEHDKPKEPIEPWATWFGIGEGPGTELGKLLNEIGIEPPEGCDCKGKARAMNNAGVEGCRKDLEGFADMMRQGADRWRWSDKISAGIKLWLKHPRLASKLNPSDPWPALIEECCERAESKEVSQ